MIELEDRYIIKNRDAIGEICLMEKNRKLIFPATTFKNRSIDFIRYTQSGGKL